MADVKVSGLPSDSSLDGNHYVVLNDPVGPTTKRSLLSTLAAFFFNQVNIPDGSGSPRTRMTEQLFDFVASGCVWSGDAYASTRLASMTSGVVYINGRRLTMSAVVSRTFTASKDTYIDILDNGDGTATIVYTEVANNAASPALAANSMRIGIIVTGATTIAAAGSVNQGQYDKVLPIASSIAYTCTDSLGNLICPRDSARRVLGYKQITSSFTTTANNVNTAITGLTCPVLVPTGSDIKVQQGSRYMSSSTGSIGINSTTQDATAGAIIGESVFTQPSGGGAVASIAQSQHTPSAGGLRTYQAMIRQEGAGTASWNCAATTPGYIIVERG